MRTESGFTFIEVAVAGTLLGVLTAVAIPMYVHMQHEAQRSELPNNLTSIVTAEVAYQVAFGSFVEVGDFVPDASPGATERAWMAGTDFDELGWEPDGRVRGSYAVLLTEEGGLEAHAISDLDGDGHLGWWVATEEQHPRAYSAADVL